VSTEILDSIKTIENSSKKAENNINITPFAPPPPVMLPRMNFSADQLISPSPLTETQNPTPEYGSDSDLNAAMARHPTVTSVSEGEVECGGFGVSGVDGGVGGGGCDMKGLSGRLATAVEGETIVIVRVPHLKHCIQVQLSALFAFLAHFLPAFCPLYSRFIPAFCSPFALFYLYSTSFSSFCPLRTSSCVLLLAY
jgi:hypothetical protein